MSYFSRLTDIVTCNLTELLSEAGDPREALREILVEMREGLAGAQRSVATAAASVNRLQKELDEHRQKITYWVTQAKTELAAGREDQARMALVRKRELEDLIAGLELQHRAAQATQEHLTTTLRALEARIADAERRQHELADDTAEQPEIVSSPAQRRVSADLALDRSRVEQVEAELEALKRELNP